MSNKKSMASSASELNRRRQLFYLFLLTSILFGIHSSASVVVQGSFIIPFALSSVLSIFSYIFLIKKVNFQNNLLIITFLFLVVVTNIISFDERYASDYILGPLQLLYSIFIASAVYLLISELNVTTLRRWCLGLTALIAALSILELNSTISVAFTRVTQALTANINLADAFIASDLRDVEMHGSVRSKVFATEPSHAALTLLSLGFGFFWTKPRIQLVVTWMIMILTCVWTIRSPIIATLFVLGPAFLFMTTRNEARIPRILIGILPVLIFVYLISDYLLTMFGTRIEADGGGDGSFDMRFTVPFQFIMNFVPNHLFVGVGIVGDFDMLIYDILAAYHERGMVYIDYNNAASSITNNLAQHFMSFGLSLGLIVLIILILMVRMRSPLVWTIVCLEFLVVWMFLGGYVAARVWVLCALILAIARRAEYEDVMHSHVKLKKWVVSKHFSVQSPKQGQAHSGNTDGQ